MLSLERVGSTRLFELVEQKGEFRFCIFWKNPGTEKTLEFDNSFLSDTSNKWLLIYYKQDASINQIDENNAEDFLSKYAATANSSVIWADDITGKNLFGNARRILLLGQEINDAFIAPDQDPDNEVFFDIGNFNGELIVNDQFLEFKKSGSIGAFIRVFDEKVCLIKTAYIGLRSNCSEISIVSDFKKGLSLPVQIPYISKSKRENFDAKKEPVTLVKLIDESQTLDITLNGVYIPFNNGKYSSFQFDDKNSMVETLFSNSKGRKLKASRLSTLRFRLNSFVLKDNAQKYNRYFLIPTEGEIELDQDEILLGSTGTESIKVSSQSKTGNSKLTLKFGTTKKVIYDDLEFNPELEKLGGSDSYTTELFIKEETEYSIDTEKSPLFKNESKSQYLTNDEKVWSRSYEPIKKGSFSATTSIPLIPTHGIHRDGLINDDLKNLERVFLRNRIWKLNDESLAEELIEAEEDSDFITPQGFRKTGSEYSFIKTEGKEDGDFRFLVDGYDNDFELSLRKNEVFFALTPKLFKKYKDEISSDLKLSARFSLNKTLKSDLEFILDLKDGYGIKGNHQDSNSESIIIFKFHNESIVNLIKEDRQKEWSNEGKLNYDLSNIRKEIAEKVEFEDQYFKDNILKNPNWNGILILNIPFADRDNLPEIFTGLSASQNLTEDDKAPNSDRLKLRTTLNMQYAAIPVNKTFINTGRTDRGQISIESTSFFGLIDYEPLADKKPGETDLDKIKNFFLVSDNKKFKFALTKLKVVFKNSNISEFDSFAFLKLNELFDTKIEGFKQKLSHSDDGDGDEIENLIRIQGVYQKNQEVEEISFQLATEYIVNFSKGNILKSITLKRISFGWLAGDFRFDINAAVTSNAGWLKNEFISINKVDFENIGLKFPMNSSGLPSIGFDVSQLNVYPDISFNGEGFLSSFPIKFSHFQVFKINNSKPDNDFYNFSDSHFPSGDDINLYSLIFDFDLGTLGDLEALKKLKGQLYFGWSAGKGFVLGFKIEGSGSRKLDVDLFGALKIEIEDVSYGTFKKPGETKCDTYFLRLRDARIKMFDAYLPVKEKEFSGIIITDFESSKTAWLMNYAENNGALLLGAGQRMGPKIDDSQLSTTEIIKKSRSVFTDDLSEVDCDSFPSALQYRPERNWLLASENVLKILGLDEWSNIFLLKFIFNDPVLYGVYLKIGNNEEGLTENSFAGLSIDILYKKLSDNLGVWSSELQLPDYIRNQEAGAFALTLPNIGIDIYTNGDWKVDIGYPVTSADWSRSFRVELLPFVGWAGIYLAALRSNGKSLFGKYWKTILGNDGKPPNMIQAGLAFRIGLGKYFHKGPFHAGASISVFGILEGVFAFNRGESGLDKLFPDHFALYGRVGAIAEIVGYVDFRIIKASVHIFLKVEIGLLLPVIKGSLREVPLYIEGSVGVRIRVRIACIKFFGKKRCIYVTCSFNTKVRFEWTLGDNGNKSVAVKKNLLKLLATKQEIDIELGSIPITYIPTVSQNDDNKAVLVNNFAINFFGNQENGEIKFPEDNVVKRSIITPIFSRLHNEHYSSYESLRALLIDDVNTKNAKLKFNSYQPTVMLGYDFETPDESDLQKFKSVFGISEGISIQDEDIRSVIIPIGKKLKIDQKGEQLKNWDNGFEILITNLFKDKDGNPDLSFNVDDLPYDRDDIDTIDRHFDGYVTQFRDRINNSLFVEEDQESDPDFRYEHVINEYFKLFGLLTLEACFNKFIDSEEFQGVENEKPLVEDVEVSYINRNEDQAGGKEQFEFLFSYTYPKVNPNDPDEEFVNIALFIDPNDVIETVINQINFFFNSGLRLLETDSHSKNQKSDKVTLSFLELLKLTSEIEIPNTLSSKADIFLKEIDENDEDKYVSIKEEYFGQGKDGLKEFLDDARKIAGLVSTDVAKEFGFVDNIFKDPFQIIDATFSLLPSSTTQTNTRGEKTNLFSITRKVVPNSLESLLSFKVKDETTKKNSVPFNPVVNIEFDVKPVEELVQNEGATSATEKKVKAVEIQNVRIQDLNLINLLISQIDEHEIELGLFEKSKEDEKVSLKSLGETTIIKTNLSTRTYPPIIIDSESSIKANLDDSEFYYATTEESRKFVMLLSEALTTNDGGFFLRYLDKAGEQDFLRLVANEEEKPIKFVLSVSFKNDVVPSFVNYISIPDNQLQNDSALVVYDIDKRLVNEEGNKVTRVKEYHSTIPVDCASFEIYRIHSNELHSQYLPIEYQLKHNGITQLSKNDVLPISPVNNSTVDESGNEQIIEDQLLYKHVSPLFNRTDETKKNKYQFVGDTFDFSFGLRDIYGHRFIKNLAVSEWDEDWKIPANPITNKTFSYVHKYFDKLIPVNAWPLLMMNIELNKATEQKLKWSLNFEVNEEEYKQSGVNNQILIQLQNILEQIKDDNYRIKVYTGNEFEDIGKQSKNSIANLIESLIENLRDNKNWEKLTDKEKQVVVKFDYNLSNAITSFEPQIRINREVPDEDRYFVKPENADHILEYDTIKKIDVPISLDKARKPVEDEDEHKQGALEQFDKELGDNLSLGIGSSSDGMKKLFIIKNDPFIDPVKSISEDQLNFFSPAPMNTSLWGGEYIHEDTVYVYKDVDIDTSLRVLLQKIELQLKGFNLKSFKDHRLKLLEGLVSLKKRLSRNSELLSNKVENVADTDDQVIIPQPNKAFDNILAKSLSNFYSTDGIIQTGIKSTTPLQGYRLSIALKEIKDGYELTSSKIDFRDAKPEWTILFDDKLNNSIDASSLNESFNSEYHEFTLKPLITHIETNIESNLTEVESSNWIQLVKPINPDKTILVREFPRITRKFPLKPEIKSHSFEKQLETPRLWSKNIGKWNYLLNLKKHTYESNDIMYISLKTKSIDTKSLLNSTDNTIEGAIAHWSKQLSDVDKQSDDKYLDLLEDFLHDFNGILDVYPYELKYNTTGDDSISFYLKWNKNSQEWEIPGSGKVNGYKMEIIEDDDPKDLTIKVSGFNLLDNSKDVVAILPTVYVERNSNVQNPNFLYSTTPVTASSWVVPYLYYPKPLQTDKELQNGVISDIIHRRLPFKITAKFLVNTESTSKVSILPQIPVKQFEANAKIETFPSLNTIYEKFENGNRALTVTIYNDSGDSEIDTSLPIIHVETVYEK